jgi:L-ribulose-5-phosphate 3-epimerase
MNEIGIMQGRLSPPLPDRIQGFPWETWREEFDLARHCGFDQIEWLFEEENYSENPLWTSAGRIEIENAISRTEVQVRSVCADFFMTRRLFKVPQNEQLENVTILTELISKAATIGVEVILLPILETSALETDNDAKQLCGNLQRPLDLAARSNIRLALETELQADAYCNLLLDLDHPAAGAYYDTGNAAAMGYDIAGDVTQLGEFICGIHIKDRKYKGQTVPLGQGDANFEEFFPALVKTEYAGSLILQTAFGNDFVEFGAKHLQFVRSHLETALRNNIRATAGGVV